MPVSGNEIASLDFANLIGGPLDAVIKAQAKSALTTAEFIKEVGFDSNGKVINAEFSYTRRDEDGGERKFYMQVPFLSMVPVPYLTVTDALIEFNAKITSINQCESEVKTESEAGFSTAAKAWFFSVNVSGKTSTVKNTHRTDKEERTFDMHISVRAKNQDMPAGTERLLTILEQSLRESKGPKKLVVKVLSYADPNNKKKILIETEDLEALKTMIGENGLVLIKAPEAKILNPAAITAVTPPVINRACVELNADVAQQQLGRSVEFDLAT